MTCYHTCVSVSPSEPISREVKSQNLLKQLPRKRSDRFFWQWPDTLWILVSVGVAAVFLWKTVSDTRVGPLAYLDSVLITAALYVGGLKANSRFAGVAGALLYAANQPLAELSAWHPVIASEIALVAIAVCGYLTGIMPLAFGAAAVLGIYGFDGLIVGLCVCVVALLQRKDYAMAGSAALIGVTLLWSLTVSAPRPPHPLASPNLLPLDSAIIATGIFGRTWWFLAPFAAEALLKATRARWTLPISALLVIAALSCFDGWRSEPTILLATPVVILMIAAGFGRLIPLIAGEYPKQVSRYAAATVAVALLLAMQAMSAKETWVAAPGPPATLAKSNSK